MKVKKIRTRFSYPLTIYSLMSSNFISSIDLIGVYLIPFFKEWGGLDQLNIQMLQSWFLVWAIVFEVPTGVFGDRFGRKRSVLAGMSLLVIAPFVYSIVPNFYIFLLAEAIFALAFAFISGADIALYSCALESHGVEKGFDGKKLQNWQSDKLSEISLYKAIFASIGRIIGSLIAPMTLLLISGYNQLFWMWAPISLIAALIVSLGVKEYSTGVVGKLKPGYRDIISDAIHQLGSNKALKKIVFFMTFSGITGFFVIWLNQVYMELIDIPKDEWGLYRAFFVSAQLLLSIYFLKMNDRVDRRKSARVIMFVSTIFVLFSIFFRNRYGLIAFLTAGAFSVLPRSLFLGILNANIKEESRATVLSFSGLFRSFVFAILSPLVGFITDVDLFLAIGLLIMINVLTIFFFIPSDEDLQ